MYFLRDILKAMKPGKTTTIVVSAMLFCVWLAIQAVRWL